MIKTYLVYLPVEDKVARVNKLQNDLIKHAKGRRKSLINFMAQSRKLKEGHLAMLPTKVKQILMLGYQRSQESQRCYIIQVQC